MSCMILSFESFKYLKEKITYLVLSNKYSLKFKEIEEAQINDNYEEVKKFVCEQIDNLHRLNFDAYGYRYRENVVRVLTNDFITKPIIGHCELTKFEKMQTYQLLQCLEYQIDELDEWDDSFLQKIKNHLANAIANSTIEEWNEDKEYNSKAYIRWGL